jgi:hypothetical protein
MTSEAGEQAKLDLLTDAANRHTPDELSDLLG